MRNRHKRMSNVAESGEEHSIIWWTFMAATMNAATFMGKNFSIVQNFTMNSEDLTLKQMFRYRCEISDRPRWDQLDKIYWQKNFMETTVTDWWWNSYQSSSHISLCLLRFCVVPRKDPSTSWFQRSLEEQSSRSPIREKATEIMMLSTESRLNSSGTSSQDSQRCSSAVKSQIYWATW